MVRFGRLLSLTYETLFTVSATLSATETTLANLTIFETELEKWRLYIPAESRPARCEDSGGLFMAPAILAETLRLQYHYYSLVIALTRLKLHVAERCSTVFFEARETLMQTARAVIQCTKYIATDAISPTW